MKHHQSTESRSPKHDGPEKRPIEGSDARAPTNLDSTTAFQHQTRTRRLFSMYQLFAFSLTYMAVWEGMCTNMYFALYNGGPNAFISSLLIVFFGACAQAASIGEMASIQPLAGAQYHWTYHLAPRSLKRIATWTQGWATWSGYVSLVASIANVTVRILESLISLNIATYQEGGWHTTIIVIAMCILQGLVNIYCFKVVPWIEFVAGILHVLLFLVFVAVMAAMGRRNDVEFIFLQTNYESSGWDDKFISWNVGMLTCVWSMTGFDSALHMSEETRRAKSAVPRAMFWSIVMNGILAFVMVIMILLSMGSIEDTLDAPHPLVAVLMQVTGSTRWTTAMTSALFVISFNSNLASIASVSRLTWAWARDGGLPSYFAYIHPKRRVPVPAVTLTVLIACALNLLCIGSTAEVAFNAIAALSSMGLYISYAVAIASILHARCSNQPGFQLADEWNWGGAGVYINVFALVYTLYIIVFLPFPSTVPVTAANMNYCGPVMGAVFVVAYGLWLLRAREHWAGPNLSIRDHVLANSG